jgi:hypothetical protein
MNCKQILSLLYNKSSASLRDDNNIEETRIKKPLRVLREELLVAFRYTLQDLLS